VTRVALLHPYWDFWERSAPFDLRADRAAFEERARAALDVEWVEPERADAVLVLQTMATPPGDTLARLPDLPVVVWAAHLAERVPDVFDHGGITAEGATVGAPMLTSVLVRQGRPFELVVGRVDDDATAGRVREALAGAAAASALRRARMGRVGAPIPGYVGVDTDEALLRERTGVEVVRVEPAAVLELYLAVTDERVRALDAETRAGFRVLYEGDGLARSLRAALALEDLVARHRLDAGALNCHVPEIRLGPEIGIAPCLGLGRLTSAGCPWTCTGDVLTAVAMLACKLIGGGAQYHELEALDYTTGEFVVASSGEHDLELAGDDVAIVRNEWFAHDPVVGACAAFSAPAGPATLVAFCDVGGAYRLVVAEGHLTGRSFPGTGTANGAFRFARGVDGWTDWCRAGAGHHSSLSRGHLAPALAACARFAGVELVRV
jgi:L-arabinose isomerase